MGNNMITSEDLEKYSIMYVSYIKDKPRSFVVTLAAENMSDIKAIVKYEESTCYQDVFYPKTDFRLAHDMELSLDARHKLMINISRTMTYLVSVK